MIESYWMGAASALWLGILTALCPCPLAGNVAAVTYIGKHMDSPRRVVLSGVLYTLGRMIAFGVMGVILVASVISAVSISDIVQSYVSKLVGPALILVGMVLTDLIVLPVRETGRGDALKRRAASKGLWGSLALGALLAMSFCPVAASVFFASLIPLAVSHNSYFAYPSLYGLGTGLPVLVFGVGLGLGARWVGWTLNRLPQIERWARRVTGVVFIVAGIYLSLVYTFAVLHL